MMKRKLKELKNGDVLMCKPKTLFRTEEDMIIDLLKYRKRLKEDLSGDLISLLVKWFDNGQYCHAALYLGEGTVAEATLKKGIAIDDLDDVISTHGGVDVYRYKTGKDLQPVMEKAREIVKTHKNYASSHIPLLCILLLARKEHFSKKTQEILAPIFVLALKIVEYYCEGESKGMICSELVFRSFEYARPPYPIDIQHCVFSDRKLKFKKRGLNIHPKYHFYLAQILLANYEYIKNELENEAIKMKIDLEKKVSENFVIPEFVTPRLLSESKSLSQMGHL